MNVPEYNQQIRTDRTAQGYSQVSIPQQAFVKTGELNRAVAYASRTLSGMIQEQIAQKDKDDKTRMIDLGNQLDKELMDVSYNPETGYYTTLGKNAVDNYESYMKNLEELKQKYIDMGKDYGLTEDNAAVFEQHLSGKLINYQKGAYGHLYKQRTTYELASYNENVDNNTLLAVHNRNMPDATEQNIINIKSGAKLLGQTLGYDEKATETIMREKVSAARASVAEALIADDTEASVKKASEYIEEHKDEFTPEKYIALTKSINSQKEGFKQKRDKDEERRIADEIYAKAPDEATAYKMVDAIENTEQRDAVFARVRQKYNIDEQLKEQEQKEKRQQFYDTVLQKQNNGEALSYDDIPVGMDADSALSMREYINKQGNPETDNQIYEQLFDKRMNDAQGFASLDLYKYRGFLKEGDFRYFLKEQEEIKKGDYYTNMTDKYDKIDEALEAMGLKGKKFLGFGGQNFENTIYSETTALVRELEARKGRKATDEELNTIINSLGYKDSDGVYLYKRYEEGMGKRVGFMRNVANDIVYYQKTHNGQMPGDKELSLIVNNRVAKEVEKEKTQAQKTVETYTSNTNYKQKISAITPKPNEQKVATYFADVEAPEISKRLGFPVRITSRYRNQKGSHHAEGRAIDVGMARESVDKRIKIYEQLVKLPYVKAIGTSDTNILSHFNGNSKIVDERAYDRKHGTNHVNHAHVTLYNDSEILRNDNLTANNGVYKL